MNDADATPIHTAAAASEPASAWRQFASWPGATSLITLLSAALLLLGLYGVIEPSIGDETSAAPRWQVLGTLSAYLGALLAGVWAMCRARSGNPDAVASAVVGTALAVGYGVVVHLLAASQPGAAAVAAAAGWLGIIALGVGFVRVAGGLGWGALGGILATLYAWTTMWPVALAVVTAREARRMPDAGPGMPGTDVAVMVWWTAGWLSLLAVLLALLLRAAKPGPAGDDRPFLATRAMHWVLALVAGTAAIVALAVQAHVAGLDLAWGDCLPHAAVLLLAANELAANAWGRSAGRDVVAVALPAACAAWIALGGWAPCSSSFRGDGWAPGLVGSLGSAPVLPLLLAAGAALLAWHRRAPGLGWGALLAVLLGLMAWDVRQPLLAEGGCLAGLVAAIEAWRRGRGELGTVAATAAAAILPETRMVEAVLGGAAPGLLLAMASGSAALLLLGTWRPAWVVRGWARAAAWILGLIAMAPAVALVAGRHLSQLPGGRWTGAGVIVGALGLILICAWRRRDAGLACAALPAGLALCWPLASWLDRAWLAVCAAFALLAIGVGIAVRRARVSRP